MGRRTLSAVCFCVLVLAFAAGAKAGGHQAASALVTGFQNDLIRFMKQAGSLGVQARYDKLIPIIENKLAQAAAGLVQAQQCRHPGQVFGRL